MRSHKHDALGRDEIRCRVCAKTPLECRDPVSPDAVAFTCSRCLMRQADAVDAVQKIRTTRQGRRVLPSAASVPLDAPIAGPMCLHGRWAENCVRCVLSHSEPRRGASAGAKPDAHTGVAGGQFADDVNAADPGSSDTGFAPLAVAAQRLRHVGRPAVGESRWARRRRRLVRRATGSRS